MRFRVAFTLILGALSISASSHAALFTDTQSSKYRESIHGLADRGVVQGYRDGTFRPDLKINRAEFLKIVMDARFPSDKQPKDLRCFSDLDVQVPQWYARPVCVARELGVVAGYSDGSFQPERTVNLAEALKMSMLAFGILPEASWSGPWYEPYLNLARDRGMLLHLLSKPDTFITRGEMAEMAYVLTLEREEKLTNIAESGPEPVCGNDKREGLEQCDDGNLLDGDGCSSICIVVPEPIRHGLLAITQQASGVISEVSRGQKGQTLLVFGALANRQDVNLTSLTFTPSVGSFLYGQNYSLFMDRDGDGIYETPVNARARADRDKLTFDAFSVTLHKDLTVPFALKADIIPTLGPVALGIQFATSLPDYVQASGATDSLALTGIETNGLCTAGNCFIQVRTRASTTLNVQERGNLYVTQDSSPTRSHILLGSVTSDALLRLHVRADFEDIDVRRIAIDGAPGSISSLLLYRVAVGSSFSPTSALPFAEASNGQCPSEPQTRMCASLPLQTLVVPANQSVAIVAVAKMKSDTLGAVSGQTATLNLSSIGTDKAFEGRGTSSLQDLAQNDGNGVAAGEIFIGTASVSANVQITGKINDTALASIRSIRNDGPAAESFVPLGNATIGSFRIDAAPHSNELHGRNTVIIQTLTFRVSAQNVQIDPLSYRLRTKDTPDSSMFCSASSTTGSFDVTCTGIQAGDIQSRISDGGSLTYVLSGNITNSQMSTGPSTLYTELAILGQRGITNSVVWSDEASVFTWVDISETSVRSTVYQGG